jgi:hypothetical protein
LIEALTYIFNNSCYTPQLSPVQFTRYQSQEVVYTRHIHHIKTRDIAPLIKGKFLYVATAGNQIAIYDTLTYDLYIYTGSYQAILQTLNNLDVIKIYTDRAYAGYNKLKFPMTTHPHTRYFPYDPNRVIAYQADISPLNAQERIEYMINYEAQLYEQAMGDPTSNINPSKVCFLRIFALTNEFILTRPKNIATQSQVVTYIKKNTPCADIMVYSDIEGQKGALEVMTATALIVVVNGSVTVP